MDEETETAGESVCWLGLLCPECGAMPEENGAQGPGEPCWRCGAVPADDSAGPAGSRGDTADPAGSRGDTADPDHD